MIKIGKITGDKKVEALLKKLPKKFRRLFTSAFAEYLVGNQQHGFRHDDPYRQTTRAAVYGRQWESDAQRRYVMGAIARGEIKLGRRQHVPTEASKGYGYKIINDGYGAMITNRTPGAYWTRIWRGWKNWRDAMAVVNANIKGALRHAASKVREAAK
jgi:hypothetical protein